MADLEAEYRVKIEAEFTSRLLKNSKYSRNAFAKFLGMTPSYYSKLQKGKLMLSLDMADKMTKKLKLSSDERKSFILSVSEEYQCHALYLIDPTYTDCDIKNDSINRSPVRVKSLR